VRGNTRFASSVKKCVVRGNDVEMKNKPPCNDNIVLLEAQIRRCGGVDNMGQSDSSVVCLLVWAL